MSACCPGPWRARDFICLPQGRGYRLHLGCMLAQMRGELNNWVQDTLNTQVIMCPVEPKGNHEHHAQGSQAIMMYLSNLSIHHQDKLDIMGEWRCGPLSTEVISIKIPNTAKEKKKKSLRQPRGRVH
eukprot:1152522-Pelagomonas_calceolata.AAC.7